MTGRATHRAVNGAVLLTIGATVLTIGQRVRATASNAGAGAAAAPGSRWRAVTIDCPPDDLARGDRLPPPLAELQDLIEVEVRPAPGDKGSELRARPRSSGSERSGSGRSGSDHSERSDADLVRAIRAALRETKQLIEVGEVLRVDPVPHGRRMPTPTGAFVELAAGRANKEGLL